MEFLSSVMYIVVTLMLMIVVAKIYRKQRYKRYKVPVRDVSRGHRWFMADVFNKPTYCVISGVSISHGAQCDSCGICVDDSNMKAANKQVLCKPLSGKEKFPKHHWTRGNLPLDSRCFICDEMCGSQPQLSDYRCCWCQRCVHDGCVGSVDGLCDLGPYRRVMVPPNCLTLKWVGLKGRKHLVVDSVKAPEIKHWNPLIVIANRKSGNNDGEIILQAFRALLNPVQVVDICDIPPENGLELCHLLPNIPFWVLVCGGDGTIGWVLNAIEKLKLQTPPQVCIVPLGTGNDLSRVLGWGEGFTGDVQVTDTLKQMKVANVVKLDRWKVEISHEKHFGLPYPRKTVIMNNYCSVGVDALVALNFHKKRESWPSLFAHRIINKFCYLTYGTKDIVERECKNLQEKIKVELDGEVIHLPNIEGVVVLNISSWGGGCQPWEIQGDDDHKFKKARYDDCLLEVMGLYSSFHIAQLQFGLVSPLRLGQAHSVKITLFGGNAPMQVDGEPWIQHPAEVTITHHSQATMLANKDEDGSSAGT